jgi:hypothetical protein
MVFHQELVGLLAFAGQVPHKTFENGEKWLDLHRNIGERHVSQECFRLDSIKASVEIHVASLFMIDATAGTVGYGQLRGAFARISGFRCLC